jgi:hypothetical protein
LNYFNYYTEIEETFVRRRGRNLFLSPLDWALMEVWQERGIPLHIVIRSSESVFDVFDKQPPGTRTIKSLFYCRDEIEAQYNEWLTAQTGKSSENGDAAHAAAFSKESVKQHILSAIETLKSNPNAALSEGITRAVARLQDLSNDLIGDFETIDKTLGDIERLLDRAMLDNWDRDRLKAAKKDIAGQLRAHKADMDADAYNKTFELMLLKRLREDAGIPRLGLFYL